MIEDFQVRASQHLGRLRGQLWSHFKRPMTFCKCAIHVLDRLHTVSMKLLWSRLEFMLSFLEMPDGCLDPRMTLGERACRWERSREGCCGGLRRPWLRVKDQG